MTAATARYPSTLSGPACAALIVGGIAARAAMLPLETVDIRHFLRPWLAAAEAAGIGYLARPFTNYTAFYEHCLALLAMLPGPAIARIKGFSILWDLALAASIALLVPPRARRAAFAVTLAIPTIAINSALLGQSDAIYATFAVLALAAAQRDRPVWAMLAFSAAIAIKLQALLFAPVLVVLMIERRQPVWTIALVPVAYLAFAAPMMLAGRPIAAIAGVYGGQFGYFNNLSVNAPSAWAIGQKLIDYDRGLALGLPAAVAATGAAILLLWWSRLAATRTGLLLAAAILLMLVPFVTPKMHDRYFYLVDPVLVALLVSGGRRHLAPLLLAETASLLAYLPFLADGYIMNDPVYGRDGWIAQQYGVSYRMLPMVGAVLMATALMLLVREAWRTMAPRSAADLRRDALALITPRSRPASG